MCCCTAPGIRAYHWHIKTDHVTRRKSQNMQDLIGPVLQWWCHMEPYIWFIQSFWPIWWHVNWCKATLWPATRGRSTYFIFTFPPPHLHVSNVSPPPHAFVSSLFSTDLSSSSAYCSSRARVFPPWPLTSGTCSPSHCEEGLGRVLSSALTVSRVSDRMLLISFWSSLGCWPQPCSTWFKWTRT